MSYLLMWLEAPMQSWGFDSKFDRRDTLDFPTRSAILGLLCSALGAGGEQEEFLATMLSFSQVVLSFKKKDRTVGLLKDFHMVGAAYDEKDSWQKLLIPISADGKNTKTKLTYRYYLQESSFGVILGCPPDQGEHFAAALSCPVWDIYLGRKNCVPTDFIYRGLFLNEREAIGEAQKIAINKGLHEAFRVVNFEEAGLETEDEILVLNDVPLRWGQNKRYKDRRVKVIQS